MKNLIYIMAIGLLVACNGFLDEKPSKVIDTPETLEALESMLDNSSSLNINPALTLIMGGDYFSDDAGILALQPWEQNLHLWKADPFQVDDLIYDFRNCYNQIQIANIILENLETIDGDQQRKDRIKGAAYFFRAHAYYNLSVLFQEGPNMEGKGLESKIPIRNTTSMDLQAEYAGLEEIKQIIREDMAGAEVLLPDQVEYPFRPSKIAAKALKARMHLTWEEYDQALTLTEELVEGGLTLMDYKNVDESRSYPFELFNQEVIWQSRIAGYTFMYYPNAFQASPDLLGLYEDNDLRKDMFFVERTGGYMFFRGSYDGSISLFGGIASDEVYLIYAECLARAGELEKSAEVLNELLINRYQGDYEYLSFVDEYSALSRIVQERRKELVFRGLRWSDLRRLNKDERFKQTLVRSYEGFDYTLSPDSERYVLPVPARQLSFD